MAQLDVGVCQFLFLFSHSSSMVLIFHIFIGASPDFPFVVLSTRMRVPLYYPYWHFEKWKCEIFTRTLASIFKSLTFCRGLKKKSNSIPCLCTCKNSRTQCNSPANAFPTYWCVCVWYFWCVSVECGLC